MKIILCICSLFLALGTSLYSDQELALKKIHAALVINDPRLAIDIIYHSMHNLPRSKELQAALVKAMAASGDEVGMLTAWKEYSELDPEPFKNRDLLEVMSWGVIHKAGASQSPFPRVISLVAAFFSQSYQGVNLIHKHLSDSNTLIRTIALELVSEMHDDKLKKAVMRLLQEETNWTVRLQAIKASGKMRLTEAVNILEEIAASDQSGREEKAASIQSLVEILETVSREKIYQLTSDVRSGLRMLACEIVFHLSLKEDLDLILPLLYDSHADVRSAAIFVLGVSGVNQIAQIPLQTYVEPLLNDPDPCVAITAAWLMTIKGSLVGYIHFQKALDHESRKVRLYAAAALSSTGKYGLELMRKEFFSHPDPYVRMNLAIGLIGQRQECDRACNELYQGLMTIHEKWSKQEIGFFKAIAPSKERIREDIPQYPEVINQLTRLEVLNILAILHYPKAQEALKRFLKERVLGITGVTIAVLLKEGDQEAMDLVRELIHDLDPQVRIQAALILALWGREPEVVALLEKAYPTADKVLKAKILEGLGAIGEESSIPFLVDCLAEPHQNLRIIAASSLLQCLYH